MSDNARPAGSFAYCPACNAGLWLHHLPWAQEKDAEIASLRSEVERVTREKNTHAQSASMGWDRARAAESVAAELAAVVRREDVRQKAHSNSYGTHWDGCHEAHDRCAWFHDIETLSPAALAKIREVTP